MEKSTVKKLVELGATILETIGDILEDNGQKDGKPQS